MDSFVFHLGLYGSSIILPVSQRFFSFFWLSIVDTDSFYVVPCFFTFCLYTEMNYDDLSSCILVRGSVLFAINALTLSLSRFKLTILIEIVQQCDQEKVLWEYSVNKFLLPFLKSTSSRQNYQYFLISRTCTDYHH